MIRDLFLTVARTFQVFFRSLMDVFLTEIEVPVLSALYKKYTGKKPSLLGVILLVAAVPITIITKLTHRTMPTYSKEILTTVFSGGAATASKEFSTADVAVESVDHPLKTKYLEAVAKMPGFSEAAPYITSVLYGINVLLDSFALPISVAIDAVSIPGTNLKVPVTKAQRFLDLAVIGTAILTTMFSIPMIESADSWDATVYPELRFVLWGVDVANQVIDAIGMAVSEENSSIKYQLQVVDALFVCFSLYGNEIIAIEEASTENTDKGKKIAKWSAVECVSVFVAGLSSSIGPLAVKAVKSPDEKLEAAAAWAFMLRVSGELAAGSQTVRSIYAGATSKTFQNST
ncbi:hypothetical protein K505DRAFT_330140 [Melanomma pulvis-pyrius CBS 109.77]|uniref:Uncharacterized protein n=1 Tax=Melanomma pulvis-pyrius CBS 109.77 TaxID=1314802 RepID=A0A6A6WRL2_9PLEO|nr:hypothetical protein K505DRAFT_330140 [Melanomma pulvis-pyrius CBS 109.77]